MYKMCYNKCIEKLCSVFWQNYPRISTVISAKLILREINSFKKQTFRDLFVRFIGTRENQKCVYLHIWCVSFYHMTIAFCVLTIKQESKLSNNHINIAESERKLILREIKGFEKRTFRGLFVRFIGTRNKT